MTLRGIAVVLLAACGAAGAAERPTATSPINPPPRPPPAEPGAFRTCAVRPPRDEPLLDATRRRLHQTVCGTALWLDGLFGERDVAAARQSYGYVEVVTSYSEFEGHDTRVRFNARLQLPALEERLSVFAGRENDDDFVRDRSQRKVLRARRRSDRDHFLLGLGFRGYASERFQSDFKVGARELRNPKFFVQNRFGYIPHADPDSRVLFRLTPFWNNHDHAGVTLTTEADRVLAEQFLLRWENTATDSQRADDGVSWRSTLTLYQNLPGESGLLYETFIRGAAEAPEPLGEYGLRTAYRQPLMGRRLYGEATLGYSWPRIDPALDREGSAGVALSVEMPFGRTPG